jgi:hypothetical protein
MLQDLQPYSCTYTNCTSADRFYGSRREWLEHEESQHRRVWICRFHPATTFSNQYDFEQHLRQQNHGHVTEAQIKDFASIAQSFAEDARPKCPICLEGSTSIPLFPAHLAHHLERIATFSIPRGIEDEDSTSLASFKAIPRSMSDRLSINSDLSTSSSQDSAASSHHEQSPLTDEIVQWFLAIGDCDLRPPAQPASSLDPALLHALQESPEYTSWYDGTSPGRLVCRADTDARKVSHYVRQLKPWITSKLTNTRSCSYLPYIIISSPEFVLKFQSSVPFYATSMEACLRLGIFLPTSYTNFCLKHTPSPSKW